MESFGQSAELKGETRGQYTLAGKHVSKDACYFYSSCPARYANYQCDT